MTPLPEKSVIGIFELFRELLNFIMVMIHDEANLDEMRVRDSMNYPGVARLTAPWGGLSGRHHRDHRRGGGPSLTASRPTHFRGKNWFFERE